VAINGVPDEPGVSHRIFAAIADRNIVVDMIAQNVGSNGKAAIGFTVFGNDLSATLKVVRPIADSLGATVEHEGEVSKVSIVGAGMKTHPGVAQRMFAALAAEQINLKLITTADIKISVLLDRADGLRALRAVHHAFDLARPRPGAGQPVPAKTADVRAATGQDIAALTDRLANMEDIVVWDVDLKTDHGRVSILGLPDRPGNCSTLFQAIAAGGIVVDMIVQNLTAGRPELSFSVPLTDLDRALTLTREAARSIDAGTRVAADANIANLFVLGVGMRSHTGVARRMFGALAGRGINISMINTSEVRISVVVDRARGEEARACLKEAFNLA
jgi:aspartate kinase